MKEALRHDDSDHVLLAPEDATEIVGEDDAEGVLTAEELAESQQALFADEQAAAAKVPRHRRVGPDARKVRAPRFSDAEFARAERAAWRLVSVTNSRKGPRPMSAHEFMREATMFVARLIEEVQAEHLLNLTDVIAVRELSPAGARSRTAQKDASARNAPVWPGAKLTTGALGLRMEWAQLPKPTGEAPQELVHAQLTEQRSRDMEWCPVEKAVLRISKKGRRRPPRYDSQCVICGWPHALPVEWPFDDAGAELDERQRAKLEVAREKARAASSGKRPAAKPLSPLRSIWRVNRRGEEPSEAEMRAELQRLGFEVVGHDVERGGWIARNATGREVVSGSPEALACQAARVNQIEAETKRRRKKAALLPHNTSALPRLTLKDKGFTKGTPGICYLCDGPAAPEPAGELSDRSYDDAVITDWLGEVHQHCYDDMPESLAPRLDGLQARAEHAAAPARLTLADKAFTKGTPDICYVCDLPCGPENVRGGWTQDSLGRAHNSCLCGLSAELTKKRDGFLGRGRTLPRPEKKRAEKKRSSSCPPGSSDEFYTPSRYFLPLHEEFDFTLDVCATEESAKCDRFFTKEQNGLLQSWAGERVWCNPPYSPGNLAAFMAKCAAEASQAELIVALVPARPGVEWWQQHIEPGRKDGSLEVRFRKGRIAFGWPGNPEGLGGGTGKFDSAFVIWRRR